MLSTVIDALTEGIRRLLSKLAPLVERYSAVRYGLAVAFPLIAGAISALLARSFGLTQLSFVFMSSVICAGAFLGARPALAAALIAFAIYNFFLVDPIFSLRLASADDVVTLLVFLIAAVVTGGLAGRLRDHGLISRRRLVTTQALFDASRRLARAVEIEQVYEALADSAAQALASPVFVLQADAQGQWALVAPAQSDALSAQDIVRCHQACHEAQILEGWLIAAIQGQNTLLGALVVKVNGQARPAEDRRTLESLASLGAVALERGALIAEMAETRALAQSELLRSALLSSISHDLRTPLATILASSTSLIDYGDQLEGAATDELLRSIRDETERMGRFVANLLDMTRLEAGALRARAVNIDITDVVVDAVGHINRRALAKQIAIQFSRPSVTACADPVLLEQALSNILENAIAFSEHGGTIVIDVSDADSGPFISITDNGPGVSAEALPRIFGKFYRAPEHASRRKGVGLGLSITKGLVEAMGGAIAVESPVAAGRGARFIVRLKPGCSSS